MHSKVKITILYNSKHSVIRYNQGLMAIPWPTLHKQLNIHMAENENNQPAHRTIKTRATKCHTIMSSSAS